MFFRKKHKTLHLSLDLTAIDKHVIARRGQTMDEVIPDCSVGGPRRRGQSGDVDLTPLMADLQKVLLEPNYAFLHRTARGGHALSEALQRVHLPAIMLEELHWMRRYDYIYHHTLAVALLVARLALDLCETVEDAGTAATAALVHDFGITRVPLSILEKTSQLANEETRIIHEHPCYSYLLLAYYTGDPSSALAHIAYEHHENLLGTGYPRRITRPSRTAQLIRLSDAFDAMISARPFRPAMSGRRALDILALEVEKGTMAPEPLAILERYILVDAARVRA